MNRLLICGSWILLFISIATAFWCYKCDMLEPRPKCPPGQMKFCWAGKNTSCSTGRLYSANALIYVQRICSHQCTDESLPPNSATALLSHEVICCKRGLCNWK